MFYDFPLEVNMGGKHDEGFDIHDAVKSRKKKK